MAKGPRSRVPFRRRREGKTNYKLRRGLVLSGRSRLVVRVTLRHVIAQIVRARTTDDEVIVSAHSRELTKTYGWRGGLGNVPTAYLTGLLCGYKAILHGVKDAVLDIGLQTPSKSARVFAALKGALDAGLNIPCSEKILPEESRIRGQHISDYAKTLSSNPEAYQNRFSDYLSRSLRPENISEHFSLTTDKISSTFKVK